MSSLINASFSLLDEMDKLIEWYLSNKPEIKAISMPHNCKSQPIHRIIKHLLEKRVIDEIDQKYYYRSFELKFPVV